MAPSPTLDTLAARLPQPPHPLLGRRPGVPALPDNIVCFQRLTPDRVSEIAERCGFNSIYHFSRAFRAAYGISPMHYRHADRPTNDRR